MRRWILALAVLMGTVAWAWADVASLSPGGKLQPFTSNVVTGAFRGEQHCFVCGLIPDAPAVLVFSRRLDEPTARFLRTMNGLVRAHRDQKLFSWFVFLGDPGSDHEAALESQGEAFGNQNHAAFVPITVLADRRGPPGYGLSASDDVFVFLTSGRKIIALRPYQGKQWNDQAVDALTTELENTLHLKK